MDILCGNIYRVTSLSKLDTYVTEMFMPNSKSIIPKLTIKAIRTDGPTLIIKSFDLKDWKGQWSIVLKAAHEIHNKLRIKPIWIDKVIGKRNVWISGRDGTLGCILYWYPKLVGILFVCLKTLGTFVE